MDRKLMSGNEAIAYGAYLAGVRVAAAYPGTPSTEILESLAKYPGVYSEWAVNEKVAADVAAGAAYTGRRALAAMKHVGLNVAAEVLFYLSYTGMEAGLVIVTCDDPAMHSSQNEQDNRHYARFAKVPMLEPSDSEEAKLYTKIAFDLSEAFDTPVLLRSTTRISHSMSIVRMEEPPSAEWEPLAPYNRDIGKYVNVPANARKHHLFVEERLARLADHFEGLNINRIEMGDPSLGIVTAGISYQHAREVFPDASFLKLGTVWPLPLNLIRRFAGQVQKLVVVEELDPFLEEQVRLLGIECTGKKAFPISGELNPRVVRDCALKEGIAGVEAPAPDSAAPDLAAELPDRPPMLCPGCAHRGLFYVLQQANAVVFGDIGCYALGAAPPLLSLHTCSCMGAGVGQAHGADKAGCGEPWVAVIGDSTFFHAGIPPLINIAYNRGTSTVVIADNRITAMTGHQDHPGTGRTLMQDPTVQVQIEELVKASGITKVDVVDPLDYKATRAVVKEHLNSPEPSVIVACHPCALYAREYGKPFQVDPDRCNNCGVCLRIGCAPLIRAGEKMAIDPLQCSGCGYCAQICGRKAISQSE